jgi:hypothetical protein
MARNRDTDFETLRHRAEEQVHSLVASLGEKPTPLEGEELENLERLSKLLDSIETLERRQFPRRRRAALVFALVLSTLLIFLLYIDRITDAEIFADLVVDEISFDLVGNQPLLGLMELSRVSAAGNLSLKLPRGVSVPLTQAQAKSLLLQAEPEGSLTLEALSLDSGTRLTLAGSKDNNELIIRIEDRPFELPLAMDGKVMLRAMGEASQTFAVDGPRPSYIHGSAAHSSEIRLKPSTIVEVRLATPLQIRNLAVHRVQQRGADLGELARLESTVLGGTIYLQDVGRTGIILHRQEPLTLREASGTAQALWFANGKWHMEFRGTVHELNTGFGRSRRNLLPTRAEWLQAQHSTWLFWSAAIYLITLVYSLLRWLGIRL